VIDAGIRTWGVPRVYATAVALALAASGDGNEEVAVFRPHGTHLRRVDLTSREGLIDHLAVLDTHPHFGDSLDALREVAPGLTNVFLVTQQDVPGDPEFRAAMAAQDNFSGYLATVDRDGSFRMSSFSPAGQKPVRQAILDLNRLLETPPRPRGQLPLIEKNENLPAIFSVRPFPLLLPATGLRRCVSDGRGGHVGITRDRRMLHWRKPGEGGLQLTDALPPGRLDLLEVTEDDEVIAVFTDTGRHPWPNCSAVVSNHATGEVLTTELLVNKKHPIGAALRDRVLFLIGRQVIRAYKPWSAQPLCEATCDGLHWVRGRVFYGQGSYRVLAYDGTKLVFEAVPRHTDALAVFESPAVDGPLVIDSNGTIARAGEPAAALWTGLNQKVVNPAISTDGRWVVVRLGNQSYMIDTTDPQRKGWMPAAKGTRLLNGPESMPDGHEANCRIGFKGILVDGNGTLVLVAAHGERTALRLIGGDFKFAEDREPPRLEDRRIKPFVPTPPPTGASHFLKVASWEDGSRAFLDGRGMLHLKSARPNVPEISLVLLANGPMAAWSSDGRVYGPIAWHGCQTSWALRHLDDSIRQFTVNLR
jgi:hypothetical protein